MLPTGIDLRTPAGEAWFRMVRTTFDNARDCGGILYQDPSVAEPGRAWSPADLAEVGGVSVRRLQQAFRQHVGTTPFGYLHDVRLKRVHDDLIQGRGASVTEIALSWGVTHLGRFAGAYRQRYGMLPSESLARSA